MATRRRLDVDIPGVGSIEVKVTRGADSIQTRSPWQTGTRRRFIVITWWLHEGRYEPQGVQVLTDDGTPVSAGDLRALPLGLVADHSRPALLVSEKQRGSAAPEPAGSQADRRYQRVARVYREAWARGERPTRAVAQEFGVTSKHAGTLVRRARERGLLPPTSQGRAAAAVER